MPENVIELFWDAGSPYTYLAATQIDAIAERCSARVTWKAFLLGKAFEATGNRAPATVPAKGKYMLDDLKRWAALYGTPFTFPSRFPINSLLAARAACAVPDGRQGDFARAVMAAYWGRDADIQQPEVIRAICDDLGLDGARVLAGTQEQPVKDRLRQNTDEAVRRGVFGAPTFFVGDRMFWGNDRLVLLENFLTGKLAA